MVGFALDRGTPVSAPAEADKGRRRIVEFRFPRAGPPFAPFVFEAVDVIAGSGISPFLIGFVGQRGECFTVRGQGTLNPFAVAIEEDDHIGLFIENEPIVRQVIVQGDFFDVLAKPLH